MKALMKPHGKLLIIIFACIVINMPTLSANDLASQIQIICKDSLCSKYDRLKTANTVKSIVWKDHNGFHFLGIDQIETGKITQAGFTSKLTAYSFLIGSDSIIKESWRIRDFAPNVATRISYLTNTLSISDIDSDGIAETCFLYCISGDCCDPWTVKLILHKNNEKLAIRGEVPLTEEDLDSYQKNFDPAFEKHQIRIRNYASEKWDEGVRMNWKNILGDNTVRGLIKRRNSSVKDHIQN